MAPNNKQYLIPGYGFIDERNEGKQWLIPGYGFTDEEAPTAGGGTDIRKHIIPAYMRMNN